MQGSRPEATKRLLVVDDEPTLRIGLAYALEDESTVVETASNGKAALEMLDGTAYDAVILDLRMPEVDGLGVVEKMRSNGLSTPVILCSSFITLHFALPAIMEGVTHFLMKPVNPRELRAAVSSVLGENRSLLGKALGAVRRSQYEEANSILEICESTMGASERAWLTVLRTLKENDYDVREAEKSLENPLMEFLVVREDM